MNLYENMLIEIQDNYGRSLYIIRLLFIDSSGTDVFTIDINNKKAFPVLQKVKELEDALLEKKAFILDNDPYAYLFRSEDLIPESHRNFRENAYKKIALIVESGYLAFFPSERGLLVKQAIDLTGSNKPTIYQFLRWYWQRGQKPNALLPNYDNCGGKGKRRSSTKKLGAPSKGNKLKGKPSGINVNEQIELIIVKCAEIYHEKKRLSLKDAHQKMQENYFSFKVKDKDNNEIPILLPEEQCPTLRQFCYWYYKYRDLKKSLIAREGKKQFHLRYREVLGDSSNIAPFPGALWQIDSTIADIYLVSSLDRSRIIGRPVLYLVVDIFSRMIVGFSVALEGPSWLGASLAIENATTDKVKFCQEFNIQIETDNWPCHHLCKELKTDRGSEYLSDNAKAAVRNLNIEISPTPANRPDWKPIVERMFRLINDEVIHWQPGAVCKPKERGERDYRLDAIYTLDEFRVIIIRLILYYNNFYCLTQYSMTKYMIQDHVQLTPCELWEWGIRNYGRPRMETPEIIRLNLLHRGNASVTRRGICFRVPELDLHDRLRYTCESANREQWFIKAGLKGNWKVPIAYDPRKPQVIYLLLDSGKKMEVCELLPASQTFSDNSLEEIMDHLAEQEFINQKTKQKQRQEKAILNTHLEQSKKDAQEKTDQARQGKSKQSLTEAIRANKQSERNDERKKNARILRNEQADVSSKLISSQVDNQHQENGRSYVPQPQETEMLNEIIEEFFANE
ncbi:DDE-type integrase/transposase/recombinase [Nostoc sp. FACHB-280]|uniref:integrase catalytic domain-containing protein n=1 Tax=Nostoc sp. FACHB-280 TaxID=2692839 RepID=UPI00168B7580|nr:DDE-type integrase/transposase/recombinase [Nostoc sp. FACHB-280]MBD2498897.1 transposase family protein [Nostoc sp. FACHB-280]